MFRFVRRPVKGVPVVGGLRLQTTEQPPALVGVEDALDEAGVQPSVTGEVPQCAFDRPSGELRGGAGLE